MFRAKKNDELVTYVGHVLHPHTTCPGNVEVWDQTLGCPECGKELWTGQTREDEFYAEHPFMFDECHDPGDEHGEWTYATFHPEIPLGGWRTPERAPVWHGAGYYMPCAGEYIRARDEGITTEHVFPVDTWSNHDPGDEA